MHCAYSLVILLSTCSAAYAIEDPFNIFCGNKDCYDVLGVSRRDTLKSIKKAYRSLALKLHPDKNKDVDTTTAFREAAKAMEVLGDVEQKELYDYYLDHPREYYKVTGKFYYRQLPKADVRLVISGVVLFLSVLLPFVQYEKWRRAKNYLFTATANNLGVKSGGTLQTVELHKRALQRFRERNGETASKIKPTKLAQDPAFLAVVEEVVGEVQIEGGYKKPTYRDVFLIWLLLLPMDVCLWIRRKYRAATATSDELSEDEKWEFAAHAVGTGMWGSLSPQDQQLLVNREVWRSGTVLDEYLEEKKTEFIAKHRNTFKKYHRYKKKSQ